MHVLSVIVPIHNDERRIRAICLEIAHAARPLVWDGTIDEYEIVLVDDGSTDGTAEGAEVFAKRDPNVRFVQHDEEKGFEAAIRSGIAEARGDLLAYGEEGIPIAAGAIRPAVEKIRAENLKAVAVKPDPKLIARFVPGRSRAAIRIVQRVRSAQGESVLPRRAARLRIEQDVPLVPRHMRVGAAVVGAGVLAVAMLAFGFTTDRKPSQLAEEQVVGRHGHLPPIQRGAVPTRSDPAAQPTARSSAGDAIVIPATPGPRSIATISTSAEAINSTCATDVSGALQHRVDSAEDESTIALDPHGCYLVGSGIVLTKRNNITIDGHGAQLRGGGIRCQTSSGVTLKALSIRNVTDHPALEIDGCSSVALQSVHLVDDESGLAIGGKSADISVNDFSAMTEHAPITIGGGERVAVNGAHLEAGKTAAFILDPPKGATVKDVELRGSTLTSSTADLASYGDGQVSSVYVHDNQLNGGRTKLYVRGDGSSLPSTMWRIYANKGDVTQSIGTYLNFSYANDVIVAGNDFQANRVPLRAAVRFSNAHGNLGVVNNDFTGACYPYTADARTDRVVARGNKVSHC